MLPLVREWPNNYICDICDCMMSAVNVENLTKRNTLPGVTNPEETKDENATLSRPRDDLQGHLP